MGSTTYYPCEQNTQPAVFPTIQPDPTIGPLDLSYKRHSVSPYPPPIQIFTEFRIFVHSDKVSWNGGNLVVSGPFYRLPDIILSAGAGQPGNTRHSGISQWDSGQHQYHQNKLPSRRSTHLRPPSTSFCTNLPYRGSANKNFCPAPVPQSTNGAWQWGQSTQHNYPAPDIVVGRNQKVPRTDIQSKPNLKRTSESSKDPPLPLFRGGPKDPLLAQRPTPKIEGALDSVGPNTDIWWDTPMLRSLLSN